METEWNEIPHQSVQQFFRCINKQGYFSRRLIMFPVLRRVLKEEIRTHHFKNLFLL